MDSKGFIRMVLGIDKTKYLRRESSDAYAGVLHNCCKVSANNHRLAFAVHRSVLGYPMVEQIDRPKNVTLSEQDDCVIVKDGFVYELKRRIE